jgi:hypothetical protein
MNDQWVHEKIRKIMREGVRGRKVSQKQAVAIAMSMARRRSAKSLDGKMDEPPTHLSSPAKRPRTKPNEYNFTSLFEARKSTGNTGQAYSRHSMDRSNPTNPYTLSDSTLNRIKQNGPGKGSLYSIHLIRNKGSNDYHFLVAKHNKAGEVTGHAVYAHDELKHLGKKSGFVKTALGNLNKHFERMASTGQAWQLVAEIAIGTLTYTDTKLQEQLTDVLVTETWEEPRADLFALHAMPNGILVGLADAGKTLCFCEPGAPYAWPREYEIPLQYAGVGIGGFGQTAVVVTIGLPYYVSGADSASMSAQKIEAPQACASKRSIVSAEGGVFYASPDGLCLAGPSGVQVLTLQHYSPEDWRALGLAGSFGCFSEGVYRLVTEN